MTTKIDENAANISGAATAASNAKSIANAAQEKNAEQDTKIAKLESEANNTKSYIDGVKTMAELTLNGQSALIPTNVDPSLYSVLSSRCYDSSLVLQVYADVYSAVEVDVSTMIGNDITFSCYGGNKGHSGFVDNYGRVIASYQDKVAKKTLRVPSNAKYLRLTYATSLSPTLILNISHNKSYSLHVLTKKVDSNDSEIIKIKEMADYSLNVDLPSIQLVDKISDSTIQNRRSYNYSLQLTDSGSNAYDAYELDVENYVGATIQFYNYRSYYGFVKRDGSIISYEDKDHAFKKYSLTIPFDAKYLRCGYANTLGRNQVFIINRPPITNINELNYRVAETESLLSGLVSTDIDAFNNVKTNRERISLFMGMYRLKAVDKTNRLVVSFNGDSIIGSQLDNITKSDEYLTGDFPPNMSKMIMARQFLDDYQFNDADVVYRNIIHSDWVKSSGAFEISNGKDEPSKTFNEIEVYGAANIGDSAEITVTGYKFFKLIWSEYTNTSKFQVLYSVNGGVYNPWSNTSILPEYIEVTNNSRCMQKYAVLTLDPANTYKFKIIATENPNNILFWGCEMWNNPRLDVVVEEFSGSIAFSQARKQLETYHSDWHTPALVVSDILSINDYSFMLGSNETIDHWMTSNITLYNRVIDNGIALLLFTPWQSTNYLTKNAVNVAIQNNLPYIDIQKKQTVLPPSSSIYGPDGLHLSDYGNAYFYDELKRILNDDK